MHSIQNKTQNSSVSILRENIGTGNEKKEGHATEKRTTQVDGSTSEKPCTPMCQKPDRLKRKRSGDKSIPVKLVKTTNLSFSKKNKIVNNTLEPTIKKK